MQTVDRKALVTWHPHELQGVQEFPPSPLLHTKVTQYQLMCTSIMQRHNILYYLESHTEVLSKGGGEGGFLPFLTSVKIFSLSGNWEFFLTKSAFDTECNRQS